MIEQLSMRVHPFHIPDASVSHLSGPSIDEDLQGSPGSFADRPSYRVGP
jgi:hypothetical protein